MKTITIALVTLLVLGVVFVRDFVVSSTESFLSNPKETLRKLWDPIEGREAVEACAGITFGSEKDSFANSIISAIEDKRAGEGRVKAAINDGKYTDLIISLARYCIPWLVLFVFCFIFAYSFFLTLVQYSAAATMDVVVVNILSKNLMLSSNMY